MKSITNSIKVALLLTLLPFGRAAFSQCTGVTSAITAGGATTFCSGGSVVLTANSTQGNALSLSSASSQYVDLGVDLTNLNKADFTIEAWVKTTGSGMGIVTFNNSNTNWQSGEKSFYIGSTGLPTFVGHGNDYIYGNLAVNDGTWHHVAVVWDYTGNGTTTTGTGKMYIDGIDRTGTVGYVANNNNIAGGTFKIGAPNYGAGEAPNYFNGQIDEVRVWNIARAQSAIASELYKKLTLPIATLPGYYTFDEASGNATNYSTGGGTGTLTNGATRVTSTAFNGGNTYSWSTGATTSSITASTSANYTVTVTTAGGCSLASSATTVTVNSATATAGSNTPCVGGTLNLTASGGVSYSWSGPGGFTSTTQNPSRTSVTAAMAGTYTVTVTDANNCTATASTTVTVNALPTATASANTPCVGGTLNLTASGGTSYSWSGPNSFSSTTQNPSISNVTTAAAGTYTVTVTNAAGCTATATTTVTINTPPAATITASGATTFCQGSSVVLSANGNYAVNFNGGQKVSVAANTLYDFTDGTIEMWVRPTWTTVPAYNPILIANRNGNGTSGTRWSYHMKANKSGIDLYNGSSVTTFNYAFTTNQWYHLAFVESGTTVTVYVNGTSIGSQTTGSGTATGLPVLFGSGSGSNEYFYGDIDDVRIWNTVRTQAQISANYTYEIYPASTGLVGYWKFNEGSGTTTADATATANNGTFIGSPTWTSSTSSMAYTYLWSTGATTQTITASAAGNYTVKVTGSNGCATTSAATTVTVNPLPTASVSGNTPCVGGTLSLTSSGGTSYSWSGPNGFTSTTQNPTRTNVTAAMAGTYTVTVTDANNCSSSASTVITINALPTAAASANTPCVGGTLNLTSSGGTSYSWTGPNSFTSTLQNPSRTNATSAMAGTYTVTVTDGNGCSSSASVVVTINALPVTTASANTPCAGGTLNLTSSGGTSYSWSGPNSFSSTSQNPSISNVTAAAAGTYTVTVTNANGCVSNASTTATINSLPIAAASGNSPCVGGTLNLTATGGTSFSWSGPNGFTSTLQNPSRSNATTAMTGTYTVTVTDGNNCSSTATVPVGIYAAPTPVITATSTTFCSGNSATLTANQYGYGLAMTGTSSQYAEATNAQLPQGNTARTIEAWVKTTEVYQVILGWGTLTTSQRSGLSVVGGKLLFVGQNNDLFGTTTINDGNWHHVAASYDGTTLSLFVDGVANGTKTYTTALATTGTTFRIGRAPLSGTDYYTGTIDEVRLWNTARTQAEIQGSMSQTVPASSSGLVAYYNFEEGTGSTAIDATGNAHATLFNSPTYTSSTAFSVAGSYLWSTGATTQAITVTSTGNYSVTTVTGYGCSATSATTTITVNQTPVATAGSTPQLCVGGTLNLTSSGGGTYSWTGPNGFTSTQQNPVLTNVTAAMSGTYTVTVTSSVGSCAATATTTTNITAAPPALVSASGSTNVCSGSSVTLSDPAAPGTALQFDGSNDYAQIPRNVSSDFTIEYWVNTTQTGTTGTHWWSGNGIVDGKVSAGTNDFGTSLLGSKLAFGVGSSSVDKTIVSTTSINDGNWHHVAVSRQQSTGQMLLYIDGVLEASGTGGTSLLTGATYLWIGSIFNSSPAKFSGTIDELRIWSVVRSAGEISSSRKNGMDASTTGLAAYYRMNEGSGTTLTNATSTSGLNGTLVNGPAYVTSTAYANTYLWSTGATTSSIIVSTTGNYSYTVTNSDGCSATSAATTVTVTTVQTPVASANTPCVGGTLNLAATTVSGASYSWTGPNSFTSTLQNPSISNVTTANGGIYTVTATINGCTSTASTTVAIGIDKAEITASATSFCTGQTATLTAAGGSALAFDGTGNYMNVPGISLNSDGGAITIEFWIKVNSTDVGNRSLFSFTTADGMRIHAHMPWSDNRIYWDYGNLNTTGRISTSMTSYLGKWVHVALVSEGKSGAFKGIYLNGTLAASSTSSDGASTLGVQGMKLGLFTTSSFFYKGSVDNFRVWKEVRTQAQIQQYMSTAISGSQPNLAAYYTFDENSGTTITDYSGNGYTGTLTLGASTTLPQRVNGVTGGNSYTYLWNTGATTGSITANASGSYSVTVTDANGCSASATPVTLTALALPVPTPSANTPCIGGTLNLTASGGTTYSWTGPNSFTSTLQNPSRTNVTAAMAGTYTVTVTDANGCTGSGSTTVTFNPLPTVSVSANSTCVGGTLNLTASGGTSYSWTGPNGFTSTNQNPVLTNVTLAMAGAYTVTVTDGNSCSAPAVASAIVNPLPVVSTTASGATTFCQGGSVTLNSSVTQGHALNLNSASSQWVNLGGNITQLGKADFTIEAWIKTTAGAQGIVACTDGDNVIESGEMLFYTSGGGFPRFTGGGNNYVYSNYAVNDGNWHHLAVVWDYSGSGTSGTAKMYVDGIDRTNTNITNYTANNNNFGTFRIGTPNYSEVSNFYNGDLDEIRIWNVARTQAQLQSSLYVPPTSTTGLQAYYRFDEGSGTTAYDMVGSYNGTLQNGATYVASMALNSGYTYSWSNGGTASSTTVSSAGDYTVTVNALTGCSGNSSPVTVTVNALPTPVASANTPCVGGTLNLTSSGGTSYAWTGPNGFTSSTQNPSISNVTAAAAGMYTVTVTDGNGCSASATTSVTINALPTAAASNSGAACIGGTVTLSAAGGTSYSWTGPNSFTSTAQNSTLASVTAAMAGTYTVTVTDGNNCSATASTTVTINALPAPTASANSPCEGGTLNLTASGGTSYSWTGPNGFTSTDQNPVLSNATLPMAGTYTVTVTDGNSCSSTATVSAVVSATPVVTLTPSGNVSTCTGTPVVISEAIGQGNSLLFDGVDDYARIPRSIQDDFTIEYWIKTSQTGSTGPEWFWGTGIVDAEAANQINDFGTSLLGSKLAFGTGGTPEKTLLSTVNINDGTWHHIAATRVKSTGQMKLYIDGVLNNSRIGSTNTLSINANIGIGNQLALQSTHFFQGELDELRLWNVARTADEIASYYRTTVSASSTGLVAYYPMNAGSGTVLANAVSSSYTGTMFNGLAWTPSTALGSTYLWNTGATTPTITVSTSGSYSVTVTNATGCSVTSAATHVTVNPLPVVTAASNSPVCAGSALNLSATGGATYSWTGPNSFSSTLQNPVLFSATAAMAGTYTVTVTDANGCVSTASATVVINALPTATAGNNGPFCEGGTLNLTSSGGTSYSWTGPNGFTSTDQNPVIANATSAMGGTYTVTVTDGNSCSSTVTTSAVISPATVASVTAGSTTTFCQGGSVTLTAASTQGTALQFTGSSTQYVNLQNNITNLSKADFTIETWVKTTNAGMGIVTVSDGDNVWETGEKSFYIEPNGRPRFVGFGSGYIISTTAVNDGTWHHVAVVWDYTGNGSTTTGTGKIYIDGVDRTSSSGYIANNNNAGTFRIGAANYGSGEAPNFFTGQLDEMRIWNVARSQAEVQGNMYQTLLNTTGQVATYRFEEGSGVTAYDATGANNGTLTNSPTWVASGALHSGSTYLWSTGATTASISATASGSYSVTVISVNNCSATSAATTVTVNPLPVATAGYNGPLCVGNTLNLTASGGTSYAWTGPNGYTSTAQNPTRTSTTTAMSGTYTVTVKDGNNCTSTASVSVVINALPVASASNSGAVCAGGTITLSATGGTSYSWAGPAGFTSTDQNPVLSNVNPGMAGTYTVTVTNSNSCSSTATTSVSVNALPGAVVTAASASACQNVGVPLTANAGNALSFDGTGHYMNVPGMNLNSNGGAITIEFWVKVNTADVSTRTLFNFTTADGNRIQAHVPWSDNRLYWDYGNLNTTGRVSTLFTSYLNQWTHVAFVSAGKNGTFKAIYINGVLAASATTSDGASTVGVQGMKLGLFNTPSTFLFKGSVDEFRVWQEVRTQSQIQQYMNQAVSGSSTNLAAYYNFDESTGTTVTDQSVNGFNGTLTKGTSTTYPQRIERGTGTYTYLWSTGATTQNITAATSGNYSVTITDANGCSATSAPLAVTVNPMPTATAANNGPLCVGSTLNLTASGGTSYTWTGPNGYTSTTQNPTRTGTTTAMSGIYTVTVTDGNGCASTASTSVTINALPVATASATADVCEGGSYTLSASGGTSYSWTGPNGYTSTDQNPVLSNVSTDATGTYTVTVSDNSCSATASVSIVVKPVMVPVITASGSTAICAGNSVTLTAPNQGMGMEFASTGSQGVDAPNAALPLGNSARTIEAWVKTTTNNRVILNWGSLVSNQRSGLSIVGGKLYFVGQNNDLISTSTINDGNWHHVAATYDGTTLKLFVDGIANGSKTMTTALATTGSTLKMGKPLGTATDFYIGTLDEVRVWNVARTQAQLQANSTHEIPGSTSGLVAYFQFQEGSGTTAIDATGNGNGTLQNSPTWVASTAITSFSSYLWSNGATTQSITVSAAGSYTVTATNTAGCSATSAPTVVTVGTTTTWTGATSTDWFTSANWTACVPNRFTDAIIPASLSRYPILSSGNAESKDLQLNGSLTLNGGQLDLYGDFSSTGNFTHSSGTFEVKGSGAQQLAGVTFRNLTINGSGTKTLSGNASVLGTLMMTNGTLNTGTDTLTLSATAQMTETATSFVFGRVYTERTVGTALESFGGIGFTLDAAVAPGLTEVTRVTGVIQTGINSSESIERYFDIHPAVNTGLDATITFKYSDWELNSIAESDLIFFRSTNNGASWSNKGFGSRDANTNTVMLAGVNSFSRWTLGSAVNPLPVELTSYTAKRVDQDALLEWTTVSEKENAGFRIEVSNDGQEFSLLGTVDASQANSSQIQKYQYVDTTPGKQGIRYYRLVQEDLDGTLHNLGIRTVKFDLLQPAVAVYPNPFLNGFTTQITTPAGGVAELVLYDAIGKLVADKKVELTAGENKVQFELYSTWPAGTYLLRFHYQGQVYNQLLIKQ